jgi:periplasmic divalent cation tolerance protein
MEQKSVGVAVSRFSAKLSVLGVSALSFDLLSQTEVRRIVMIQAAGRYRIVLVTCDSMGEARSIGRGVVEKRLAACANIVAGVESIYRWKGKVERAREVLVVIKTTTKRLRQLEREVKRVHSYEVPEFVVLPIVAGSREYLKWIGQNAG